ncbi:phosphate ABC transporter substrate-binding protein [Chromatiales bacterium (ex Bugula neritina AB1)]|nr:phosphate ABC transporter substrate-binding protein [Chromatiales bacterium (ex Bugula neritina AB1)]
MGLRNIVIAVGLAAVSAAIAAQTARDQISIVGSSTVYPFATIVAERFGQTTEFKTPKIESTGSGGGMKLFCAGVGVKYPDITNSSRRMKKSEFDDCQANGVNDITEVLIGYDGIAVANSVDAPQLQLTRRDLYLALAKMVPSHDGSETLVANPYQNWSHVNPALPDAAIEVLGPPPTSGTRDAFAELAMEGGCKSFHWIAALKKSDKNKYKEVCHTVREDGAYIESGENDNLIVQKLQANPNALGVFGYSFLDQNSDAVHGSLIDGEEPTFETIADGRYPVSRPLYFYVKQAHVGVIPGIAEYLEEFTSATAWGEDGYLAEKGMIPLGDEEREEIGAAVKEGKALTLN